MHSTSRHGVGTPVVRSVGRACLDSRQTRHADLTGNYNNASWSAPELLCRGHVLLELVGVVVE